MNLDQALQTLLEAVVSAVAAGLIALITQAFTFLKTKTQSVKSDQLRSVLFTAESEAERLTHTIIASLNQTVVNDLKAQNGNKLTPADAARIKDDALNSVKSLLSSESRRVLTEHKGDLLVYLGHLLEEVVNNNNKK